MNESIDIMSNKSNGPKNSIQILNIVSDFNTGRHIYKIDFWMQESESKTQQPTMNPFAQTSVPYWKPIISVYLPDNEWKGQYQVGEKYDFSMSDTGDITLRKK